MNKLRVALIVLYDREGRFLLQHRTTDAEILPGYWAFFGGGIKEGESPEEAVRREAFEELNYIPRMPRLVRSQRFMENGREGYLYLFLEPFYEDKSSLVLQEGQGWGWFKGSETSSLKISSRDRRLIEFIERYIRDRKSHPERHSATDK
jgi:8-oxo-dGTP pyrophosphatase MutT (NUDIX family)